MISREDFVFTIGYEGDSAVVDGKAKAAYGKLGTMELLEAGLFRAAFASALYGGSKDELDAFARAFNALAGTSFEDGSDFSRLFGVKTEEIKRVLVL